MTYPFCPPCLAAICPPSGGLGGPLPLRRERGAGAAREPVRSARHRAAAPARLHHARPHPALARRTLLPAEPPDWVGHTPVRVIY